MRKVTVFIFLVLGILNIQAQNGFSKSFIAMEYKGMSNQIFKVFITDNKIIGIRVNGYISVENSFGVGFVVPAKDLKSPNAYADKSYENKYLNVKLDSDEIVKIDNENFIINKIDVIKAYHNPNKKWGMGYYPHNGRIFINTKKTSFNKKSKRELILIGEQDGKEILAMINQRL